MRREIPVLFGSVIGAIVILEYYVKLPLLQTIGKELVDWGVIISAFALCLASINLLRKHVVSIARRERYGPYSILLLIVFGIMTYCGIALGPRSAQFRWFYDYMLQSISATIYGTVAFYLLSASFRTFRARNVEATLLLVSAVLVMLGRATIGSLIWDGFGGLAEWLLGVPNAAANRGVLIGAALGLISTGVRLLLGIDRAYLGSD